jgi:hypothetical protein
MVSGITINHQFPECHRKVWKTLNCDSNTSWVASISANAPGYINGFGLFSLKMKILFSVYHAVIVHEIIDQFPGPHAHYGIY